MSKPALDPLDTFDFNSWELRRYRRSLLKGPQVGDFVQMPGEKDLRRFTHKWNDGMQTTVSPQSSCYGDVSFYIDRDGRASFSGSLDPELPFSMLADTGRHTDGTYWFFHHEQARAHNGITCQIPSRIWRYTGHTYEMAQEKDGDHAGKWTVYIDNQPVHYWEKSGQAAMHRKYLKEGASNDEAVKMVLG